MYLLDVVWKVLSNGWFLMWAIFLNIPPFVLLLLQAGLQAHYERKCSIRRVFLIYIPWFKHMDVPSCPELNSQQDCLCIHSPKSPSGFPQKCGGGHLVLLSHSGPVKQQAPGLCEVGDPLQKRQDCHREELNHYLFPFDPGLVEKCREDVPYSTAHATEVTSEGFLSMNSGLYN